MSSGASNFEILPGEILRMILRFLPPRDRGLLLVVCRQWNILFAMDWHERADFEADSLSNPNAGAASLTEVRNCLRGLMGNVPQCENFIQHFGLTYDDGRAAVYGNMRISRMNVAAMIQDCRRLSLEMCHGWAEQSTPMLYTVVFRLAFGYGAALSEYLESLPERRRPRAFGRTALAEYIRSAPESNQDKDSVAVLEALVERGSEYDLLVVTNRYLGSAERPPARDVTRALDAIRHYLPSELRPLPLDRPLGRPLGLRHPLSRSYDAWKRSLEPTSFWLDERLRLAFGPCDQR
jgi:hypothetical protein